MADAVGLDIGTSAVRAAEIDVGATPPELLRFGQVGLTPGSVIDGEVRDVTAVASALQRLWQNGGFSSKSVVVGIAGPRAITREMDIQYVPDDEIEGVLRFQSEEVIPFPPDRTSLGAQVLADYQTPDGQKMRRILVGAAHRDLVDGVVAAVGQAGLELVGIDLVPFALLRAMTDATSMAGQPEVLVSVGAGLTIVMVHQAGVPQLVRTIATGGSAVTGSIAGSLDLPFADAESLKKRLGEPIPQIQAA